MLPGMLAGLERLRAADTIITADSGYYSEGNLKDLESRGIEQRVFPSVQCHHAKAQRLVRHGAPQFGERLGHELKRAVTRDFFSGQRRQRQCALVDSEENKIGWRRRLPTFAPK
jgi:hypothetical protein